MVGLRLLPCLLALPVAGCSTKDVLLWTTPDSAGGTVSGIAADVKAKMAFGVTVFAMCGYDITPDFSGLRPQSATVEPIGAALRSSAPQLRQVPQLCLPAGSGTACSAGDTASRVVWGRFLSNATARGVFIVSAVRLMKAQQYDGFNIDIEQLSGRGSGGVDRVSYGRFLDEFAGAVQAAGGRLSADIDWCGSGHVWDPHYDYMGMRCKDYATTR